MKALSHFTSVIGLEANSEKPNIFITEVNEDVKQSILDIIGFSTAIFPLRYLGLALPLQSRVNRIVAS